MSPLPEITGYQFGRMTIAGKKYTNDLIILPTGNISENWFRKSGHLLNLSDLDQILEFSPDVLIIGTGASGRMNVDRKTLDGLILQNIEPVIHKTGEAVDAYNRLLQLKKIAACFHLTC